MSKTFLDIHSKSLNIKYSTLTVKIKENRLKEVNYKIRKFLLISFHETQQ